MMYHLFMISQLHVTINVTLKLGPANDFGTHSDAITHTPGAPNYGQISGVTNSNYCYFDHS